MRVFKGLIAIFYTNENIFWRNHNISPPIPGKNFPVESIRHWRDGRRQTLFCPIPEKSSQEGPDEVI